MRWTLATAINTWTAVSAGREVVPSRTAQQVVEVSTLGQEPHRALERFLGLTPASRDDAEPPPTYSLALLSRRGRDRTGFAPPLGPDNEPPRAPRDLGQPVAAFEIGDEYLHRLRRNVRVNKLETPG